MRSHEMLSRRGALGFGAAVLARLAWFLVLEVALWSVGVTWEELPPSAVLTAMAAVALVALIPITPGAIGVSEIAYVGLLSAVAGDAMTAPITAAIVMFRTAQWLDPDPARLDPARDHAGQPLARARGRRRGRAAGRWRGRRRGVLNALRPRELLHDGGDVAEPGLVEPADQERVDAPALADPRELVDQVGDGPDQRVGRLQDVLRR